MTDIFEIPRSNLFNVTAVTETSESIINIGHLGDKLVSYSQTHPILLIALAIIVAVTVVFLAYKYLSATQTGLPRTPPLNREPTLVDTQAAAEAERARIEADRKAQAAAQRGRIEAERLKVEAANKEKAAAEAERLRIQTEQKKAAAAEAEKARIEAEKAKAAAAPFDEQNKYLETVGWMEYKGDTFAITGIRSGAYSILELPVHIPTNFSNKATPFRNYLNEAKEKLSANKLLEPAELSEIKRLQAEVQDTAKTLYDKCPIPRLEEVFIMKTKTK